MTIRDQRSALPLTSVFLLYALPVLSLSNGSKACLSLCPMPWFITVKFFLQSW
jgi:hypothetical protein